LENHVTTTIEIHDLPFRLEEALALTSAGREVILAEGAVPRARLVPIRTTTSPRVAGLHPQAIQATADFDEPLADEFWVGSP